MVDAVLLEWEGVLADTRPARRDALRAALAAEGVAHTLSDDDEQLRGLGVSDAARAVVRHMGSSDEVLADLLAVRAARTFAETIARGLVLHPGAAAFVEHAQSRARIAVVTRASRAETELVLRMAGLEDAVTTIVTADEDVHAPSEAGYRLALAGLSRVRAVDPARVVALVDASPAIRAARGAGVRVIAVGAPVHQAIDADAAVDSLVGLRLDEPGVLSTDAAGRRA
jgi:beta-phosphoglucomutase-like phosphatase (HAD superfamily)